MHLNNIQRFAIFTAGITAFIGLMLLSLKSSFSLEYSDFIVGHIAWNDGKKFQDLMVMPVAIFGTVFSIVFLLKFFEKINQSISEESSKNIALYIIFWAIPAITTISSSLLEKNFDLVFFSISMLGMLFLVLSYSLAIKRNYVFDADAISMGLISIFFISLIPLNLAILIRFFPTIFHGFPYVSGKTIETAYLAFLLIFLFGYLLLIQLKKSFPYKEISILILLGQLSLPLLYVSLYPAKMQDPLGNIIGYDTGIGLKLIIAGLILAALIDIIYRYRKYHLTQNQSIKLLSPLAICALLVSLKAGVTVAPTLSADDYHFGEHLLGWWVYLEGYIPYIDYTPVHGIINNDLVGLLNFFFYDGTAASLAEAQRLALYLLSITAFLSVYYFTGSILWAFISIYFLGARIVWLFFLPFIVLWFNRSLIENKIKWSIIWLITAPIVILGVPPQGLLLVVASGVIPLYFLWRTIINKEWMALKPVALFSIFLLLLYLITPLGSMLFHAINYVLVNGSINQAAYGVPWSLSFTPTGVLFEAVRMSWVIVPFISIFALYFLYTKKQFHSFLVLPLLVTINFSFLSIPYSMGRIDPGSVSRPGIVGILLIAGIMGLAFWQLLNRYNRVWLFMGMVFFASLLKFANLSHQPLLGVSVPLMNIGHIVNAQHTDLKNIGAASMEESHWNRISNLNILLNSKLRIQESYLDLTSRNAQYFYLNRKPVIPITAPYNMISYEQQLDAISILKNNLPRLSLLEGDNIIHDGGGVALRNHYLYRFILEQYEPFEEKGFIIGLSKESIINGDWGDVSVPNNTQKMVLFEKSFSRTKMNLEKIPTAWGKSIETLKANMIHVLDFDSVPQAVNNLETTDKKVFNVKGIDPFTIYDLSHLSIAGKSAGLLKLDFECVAKQETPILQIFWWGDEQAGAFEESSILLSGSNGTLIVPLDASPRWLLLNHIKGLRIDLSNPGACASYKIKNLSLYQRKLVDL